MSFVTLKICRKASYITMQLDHECKNPSRQVAVSPRSPCRPGRRVAQVAGSPRSPGRPGRLVAQVAGSPRSPGRPGRRAAQVAGPPRSPGSSGGPGRQVTVATGSCSMAPSILGSTVCNFWRLELRDGSLIFGKFVHH